MPRVVKRVKHLSKHHRCAHRPADLTLCDCSWLGRYKGREIVLAKWCGKQVDPRKIGEALAVLRRFITAVDEHHFDPAGELPPLGTEQTFRDFCDEWKENYAVPQGLSMNSLGSMIEVVKASPLGRRTLAELAGSSEAIERWLDAEQAAREFGNKMWMEYRNLIGRICKQAMTWTRGGKPRMATNPIDGVATKWYSKPKHFQRRHFDDAAVEAKLFAACDRLDRPQHRPNRNKLTQEKADAIFLAVEEGRLQKDLAREYNISPAVVCAIVKGQIWNPLKYVVGTKGREMRRRLMAAFDCGLRATEMLLIQVKHVDWRHPRPLVSDDGVKFNGYMIMLPAENTKGGKSSGEPEAVYVTTLRLSQELEARRFQLRNKPDAYIFGTEAGAAQAGFKRMWRELFRLAGLAYGRDNGLVWHTTRHEYISRMMERTNDPRQTQKNARHKRLETTLGYSHTRNDAEWAAAVAFSGVTDPGRSGSGMGRGSGKR